MSEAARKLDSSCWMQPAMAAAVFAVDPAGLGGLVLRAQPGPVRELWLQQFRDLLPADTPWRRLPRHIADERLMGGLDLTATLSSGRPIAEPGLLAETDGGVLVLAMAERLEPGMVARLAAVLDTGQVALERGGLSRRMQARLGMIALDEGLDAEESTPAGLTDRFAIHLSLESIGLAETSPVGSTRAQIDVARKELGSIRIDDGFIKVLCLTAVQFGIDSLRVPLAAVRVARIAAALDQVQDVTELHIGLAAQLVFAGRATRLPPTESETETEPEQKPAPQSGPSSGEDDQDEQSVQDPQTLQDQVLDATQAVIPPGLLEQLRYATLRRGATRASGKSAARHRPARRGRRVGMITGQPAANSNLNLVETLRAAAPWQTLRRKQKLAVSEGQQTNQCKAKGDESSTASVESSTFGPKRPPVIHLRRDDFRIHRYQQRAATTTVFVVDASGSAALHRLAEVKGAVELLLAESYQRRDQVALVAFRGQQAELLLPPTRSLVRAKRALAGLPGGGGTPLASGLDLALDTALSIRRKGDTPVIILLTDGRANVTLDGQGNRQQAQTEAIDAARAVRAEELTALLVDTSPRPRPLARQLAEEMAANYLPLPQADAIALSQAAHSLVSTNKSRENS
ncbi:MAG: magnesium chelatase subunit D [Gammaproteobacteria bacterium]|nr:magnesium chelatase subunit D [Gammaproteobacteria bacterium]